MEMFNCKMYTVPNRGRAFCDGLRKLYCGLENKPCPFYKPKSILSIEKDTKLWEIFKGKEI